MVPEWMIGSSGSWGALWTWGNGLLGFFVGLPVELYGVTVRCSAVGWVEERGVYGFVWRFRSATVAVGCRVFGWCGWVSLSKWDGVRAGCKFDPK